MSECVPIVIDLTGFDLVGWRERRPEGSRRSKKFKTFQCLTLVRAFQSLEAAREQTRQQPLNIEHGTLNPFYNP